MVTARTGRLGLATLAAGLLVACGTGLAAAPKPAWVIPTTLNIRALPGTDKQLLGQLKQGEKVYVVAFNDRWCKISYHGGKRGWVAEEYLQFSKSKAQSLVTSPPSAASNPPAWIKGDDVNCRSGPGTGHSVVARADTGTKVYITASQSGWYRVKLPSGAHGWVRGDLVERNVEAGRRLASAGPVASAGQASDRAPKAYVKVDSVNVRNGPGSRFDATDRLPKGTTVWVIGEQGQWRKVKYGNGEGGWIADWLLKYEGAPKVSEGTRLATESVRQAEQPLMSLTAWIGGNDVNVRNGPGMEYEVKTTAAYGTKVTVLDLDGHWCKVRLPDGMIGWVAGWVMDYVGPGRTILVSAAAGNDRTVAARVGWVTGDAVNLRARPGTDAAELEVVAKGTEVVILDREGDWFKIATSNNKVGWMHTQYIESREQRLLRAETGAQNVPPTQVARVEPSLVGSGVRPATGWPGRTIVRTAKSYLGRGIPYRLGGASTKGFDCSGFVMTVLAKHGVKLPHRAAEQHNRGKAVPRGQEMPGDLVFFKNTYRRGISHVGIYIGDGEFIHCSSSRNGVVVSRLDTGYYGRKYVGARRMK